MIDGLSLIWPWNPGALVFLIFLSLFYLVALRQAHRRTASATPVKRYQVVSFFSAIIIMALLLLTPIDTIARTQLFSVHMAQTVLLTTLCAPLILWGCPEPLLRPLFELPIAGSVINFLTRPVVASITFNLLFLLWHTQKLFQIALWGSLYHVMILSIFCASLLNWWPLIGSMRNVHRMSYPMQILYAFFDGQPVDIFAFVLVFTGIVIYPYYAVSPQLGISPFADQAVGGALLLIPGLVDLGVMSPLFFSWLGQIEAKAKIEDQRRQELAEQEEEEETTENYFLPQADR